MDTETADDGTIYMTLVTRFSTWTVASHLLKHKQGDVPTSVCAVNQPLSSVQAKISNIPVEDYSRKMGLRSKVLFAMGFRPKY